MRIHRTMPEKHFTQISNDVLRDERLGYAARGVLCELLSRPDGWDVNADTLAANARAKRAKCGEGRRPMRAIFSELTAAGYLIRTRHRDDRGRMVTELHLYDQPQDADAVDAPDDGGTSVPPARSAVSAGHTDVPVTDDHPGGTSNRTLSKNTKEHGPEDLASRRARAASRTSAKRTIQTVIRDVKKAITAVDGHREAVITSDAEALGLYFTYIGKRQVHDVTAYMIKILGDCGTTDGALSNSEAVCVACVQWASNCACESGMTETLAQEAA